MARSMVLIVEDDAITRFMMGEICDRLDYPHRQASTGTQCLDMMQGKGGRADIVLMDIHMPGLSGVETCARLRSRADPHHRVAIIAVTADEFWQDSNNSAAAGFDGVLRKPISIDGVRQVLTAAVSGEVRRTA